MGSSRWSNETLPVRLNVYDLGHVSKWVLNSWASRVADVGVFHVGVEVLGVEFCFQAMEASRTCKDDDKTGLTWHYPRSHPRHVFRESISLGVSRMQAGELQGLLKQLEMQWPARCYNPISRNCVDFAEQLVEGLHTTEPFPAWVHGLAKGLARNTRLADLPGLSVLECSKSSVAEAQAGFSPPLFCNSGGAPEAAASGLGALLQRIGSFGSMRGVDAQPPPGGLTEAAVAARARDDADRPAAGPAGPRGRPGADRLRSGLACYRTPLDQVEEVNVQCSLLRR